MRHREAGLKRFIGIITAAVLVASAVQPVAAQDARDRRTTETRPRVPDAFTPPAGMCRLWIDGVPASQQPAPTDCANAIRNRPSNAAVLFGPQRRGESLEMRPFTDRTGRSFMRPLLPSALNGRDREEARLRDDAARVREEIRTRAADTTPKPAPRKPEKPQ